MAINELMSLEELPENPYLFLANRMRLMETEVAMWEAKFRSTKEDHLSSTLVQGGEDSDDELRSQAASLVNNLSEPDKVSHVCHVANNFEVFGYQHLLKLVDVDALKLLHDALVTEDNLFNIKDGTTRDGQFLVHYLSALMGPCIFLGRFLRSLSSCGVDIKHEYLIEGPAFEKGVNVFTRQLAKEVVAMQSSTTLVLDGLYIDQPPTRKGTAAEPSHWLPQSMRSEARLLMQEVKAAVLAKRSVRLQGLVRLHLGPGPGLGLGGVSYVPFVKNYTMHFRKQGTAESRSFTPHPCSTLCGGIFFHQQDAHTYASLFHNPPPPPSWGLPTASISTSSWCPV
jgi:hypothetical protein